MTSAPDPADVTGPDLPRDPADYAPRRRGLGAAFWAMIAFGVFCAVAGLIVGRYGPRLFPVRPKPAASAPPAAASPPAPATPPAPAAVLAPPPAAPAPPAPDVAVLGDRLDHLQVGQQRIATAAAASLAAAELSEAAQSAQPFAGQLASLQRLLPASADLAALRPLAQSGAPGRAALAAQFAPLADRAALAARAPGEEAGVTDRLRHLMASIFVLRRIDRTSGNDPDAILARAQRLADDGDLAGALAQTDTLPPAGREALADWRERARRRVDIDRLVAGIRAGALRDLAQATPPGPVT
jgi:hypothetical protein